MPELLEVNSSELRLDTANANLGTTRGDAALGMSLREYGAGRSILVDRNGAVIAGNKTLLKARELGISDVIIVQTDGTKIVAVQRMDLDLAEDSKARALAYADNRVGQLDLDWDVERLARDIDNGIELPGELWEKDELDELLAGLNSTPEADTPKNANATLAERFLIPPFSILDARQGYWQQRKRAWKELGIASELGRGAEGDGTKTGLLFSSSAQPPSVYLRKNEFEKTLGRKVSWDEFYEAHPEIRTQSNDSIFDPVLCEIAYRWFTPKGGAIFDPFAGGSVRGAVASRLGFRYTGIDLRPEQIDANDYQADGMTIVRPQWIQGDSRYARDLVGADRFDFVFSCPPYYDLERYSSDDRDLSNLGTYEEFIAVYREIIAASVSVLSDDRFACFVVGDIRDAHGLYRNFVSDTIAAFRDAGAHLYNEAILITQAGSLAVRAGRQFSGSRKLGKTHQNVLVFVKGDPKRAAEACGVVDVSWPDEEEAAASAVGVEGLA